MEALTTVDIYELSEFRNGLLCDLIAACPAGQYINGCEIVEGKIVSVFYRLRQQTSTVTRSLGSPPRGVFDLRDAGASIVIMDRLRPNAQNFDSKLLGHRAGCLLIPVRTMQCDLDAAIELISIPGFRTHKKYAFVVLETVSVPGSFFESLAALGPIVPVRLVCRAQEIGWEPIEETRVILGKTVVTKSERKIISSEAVSGGEAVWKWLTDHFELPQPRSTQIDSSTKEERDAQLAALYNNLRQTIPPQLATPVRKLGGQQADVIMMLVGVIDGTLRLYIDQDQHASHFEFMVSHLKRRLFGKDGTTILETRPKAVDEAISADAKGEILLNWHKLSLGDLSIILATLAKADASVVTSPNTPHWYFWVQLVRLEWASTLKAPSAMAASAVPLEMFKLTSLGMDLLPKFIEFRKLVVVTNNGKIEPTAVVYERKS